MSDVRQLLACASERLGGPQLRVEAELLLAHALGRSRAWLFAWPEFEPGEAARALFGQFVEARRQGRPIAYLTGKRAFWSLDLAVSPAVLIPRPETELLVELALARIAPASPATIADLGTGSGAIALAIASERPRARILATDASAQALCVARDNAERLAIVNVDFAQGDWCAALRDGRFDLIASNPPYIAAIDPHLCAGDLRHEPPSALASGVDGLDALRAIVAGAPGHLTMGGELLLEHGWQQGDVVRALLRVNGFVDVDTARDLGGRERVSFGRLQHK